MEERNKTFFRNLIISHRVVDGDTIELEIDLGFNLTYKVTMRLFIWDAPETTGHTAIHKQAGLIVEDAVTTWMALARQYPCLYHSIDWDSRGRNLGDIESVTFGFLSDYLSKNGLVQKTDRSGKRLPWSEEDLLRINQNKYPPPEPIQKPG